MTGICPDIHFSCESVCLPFLSCVVHPLILSSISGLSTFAGSGLSADVSSESVWDNPDADVSSESLLGDPNVNACVHLEDTEPEILTNTEGEEVEEEEATKAMAAVD